MAFSARRLVDHPIIYGDMDDRMGRNINGPSLIRAPDWLPSPPGRYLLYFADHKGTYLRLAYADALEGPWSMHTPGCLNLADSLFPTRLLAKGARPAWVERAPQWYYPHIASPDVHVDDETQEICMYFHGMLCSGEQATRMARSRDGLTFSVNEQLLGPPYFRTFQQGGFRYAFALPNHLMRSALGTDAFEPGPTPLPPSTRHTAVRLRGEGLEVFWSEIGDAPERIYAGRIDLTGDWTTWQLEDKHEVLRAELDWEGALEPPTASAAGAVDGLVNQLRDPCVFEEDGRLYLLYSASGEAAIGIAELTETA